MSQNLIKNVDQKEFDQQIFLIKNIFVFRKKNLNKKVQSKYICCFLDQYQTHSYIKIGMIK